MIFDRIMLPAQGRNEDYKFAQTGSITLVASAGGGDSSTPAPSWLENVIKIDPESGYSSVQDWHVKGNLVIEGQVNQWLAQQLVVDDARIQVTWKQDGATVDSGLVIYNKDTGSEVSSLVYDVNGIWKAGGDRLFTEAYNPKLGGYAAGDYPRKAEASVITQRWTFSNSDFHQHIRLVRGGNIGAITLLNAGGLALAGNDSPAEGNGAFLSPVGNLGLGIFYATERLHVAGNGLFTGNLTAVNAALSGTLGVTGNVTAGGNVGTSNFVSQMQGWRVTPQGQADFRHIFTDELQAKAFTADISQALVGSDVLTKSVAKLAQNWATTANGETSTIYVEELEGFPDFQVFAVGDRLLLRLFDRSGGGLLIKNIWATVASYVSTTKNVQRYTITVNSGGATGQTVYAGSMILDYGTPGSGVIERTVLDQQGSPYSRVSTWVNNPWTPGNYTLHYQSGNLNGISNAEGWGVYSENSFLTGKLLVGDLTKAGQYMEYENGQLNIKGKITVTGGNAATKEYVDAVQVGGRNLALNQSLNETVLGGFSTTWQEGVHLTSSIPVTGDEYVLSFEAKSTVNGDIIQCFFYSPNTTTSAVSSTGHLSSNGDGRCQVTLTSEWKRYWVKYKQSTTTTQKSFVVGRRYPGFGSGSVSVRGIKLELGNRATDWTPAPEDVPSALEYLAEAIQDGSTDIEGGLVTTNVLMVKDTNGTVRGGMSGLKSDNVGFWTGGTYQNAVGGSANVIFRKDGSFSLADGKISGTAAGALSVDGGVVTGNIESQNWDGENGSRLNLLDGSLEFGNTIKVDSFAKEIIVKDGATQNTGVRIGDFLLSPTAGGAGALDEDLSGSRTVDAWPVLNPQDPPFVLMEDLTYINGSGVIGSSSSTVSTNLTAGNNYTFQTNINVRITRGNVLDTATDIIGAPLTITNSISKGGVRPNITVSLFSGATKVGEQFFAIKDVSDLGVATFSDQSLSVNIPFVAASSSLRVEITQSGEVVWKVRYPASQGNLVEFRNAGLVYSELNTSSRVRIVPSAAINELSAKGFLSLWGPEKYFRIYDRVGVTNFIEARGVQMFISPNGNYRLRISDSGIQKSVNGGSWTSL